MVVVGDVVFEKPIFGRKVGLAAGLRIAEFLGSEPELDIGGLTGELQRLDLFEPGLGRKGIRYVATGVPVGFPQLLEPIVAKVGRSSYSSPYFKDSVAVNAAHGASDVALAKGEVTDAQVVSRFIAVRRVVRPSVSQPGWGQPPIPEAELPVRELLAAISQGDGRLNSHSHHLQPQPEVVPTLSPREVLDLVLRTGGDTVTYFKTEGLRSASVFSRRDGFKAEFAQLVAEHPKDFAQAMVGQRNEGGINRMVQLAETLGALTNPAIMAAVFGLLGKGNAKEVREHSISTLARLDQAILPAAIRLGLAEGELEMRYDLVQVASRAAEPVVLEVLHDHLPNERSAKVKGAIEAILGSHSVSACDAPATGNAGSLTLANGEILDMAPVDESLLALPSEGDRAAFERLIALVNARRAAVLADGQERKPHQADFLQPISASESAALFDAMRGEAPVPQGSRHLRLHFDLRSGAVTQEMRDWFDAVPAVLRWRTLLWLGPVASFATLVKPNFYDLTIVPDLFAREVAQGADILAFSALCDRVHQRQSQNPMHVDAMRNWLAPSRSYYEHWKNPLETCPKEAATRVVAASLSVVDEALGLAPATLGYSLTQTYSMLAVLPAVPERYVPKLVELGLSGKSSERTGAQQLLRNAKTLVARLEEALNDRRQDVRAHAACWLADVRATGSEKALRKRLKGESAEGVRAALIEALLRIGADLSDVIGPAALVAEADKARGKLELPEWLPVDLLPLARFADGRPAPRALLEYWIAMAVKLKDPGNTGLFGIYLDQLMPDDAKALSGRILQGWIDYDTYGPSLDEANAYASQRVDAQFQWLSRYRRDVTRGEIFEGLKRDKLKELPNTGTKSKGILALACRADPAYAAERVRWFLKKHGRRSHQAMALLDLLAGMNSPPAMQVVIAAATRLKQKSTMAHANAIAERYASDRGWSYDELADRTVPTAGFDDDGVLELPCGTDAKAYCARIDASLTIHLYNPAGKVVSALPGGDDEDTQDSKKALSAAKKELKQVVAMQTDRLQEALCSERGWPVADWLEAFHGHPVMRRLIERLVWQGLDAEGAPLVLFRATQEGDFTDAADEPVELAAFASVRLAHAAMVGDAEAAAWRKHLKDYEIKPLLDQFPAGYRPLAGQTEDATQVSDRFGWVGQSLSYRGLAEKRGYERVMGDGGGCIAYEKRFPGSGIVASIENSGSHAQDENDPVVLKHLTFRRDERRAHLPLGEVPAVLLAACHADLHAIAAKGAYAEDWENQVAW